MVAEPPPQLLSDSQLLLADRGVPPVAVLVLSSSTSCAAAPPVQDGPLGVVGHRVINCAEVAEEVKVLQDMFGQFGLENIFLKKTKKRKNIYFYKSYN